MSDDHSRWLRDVVPSIESPTLLILRGCSGCGKSSLTKAIVTASKIPYEICSADDYFIARDGAYNFDRAVLKQAHAYCRARFEAAVSRRCPLIVIDNTNTQAWQYEPYIEYVRRFNRAVSSGATCGVPWRDGSIVFYDIRVLSVDCPSASHLWLFAQRNSHGVGWDTLLHQWLDWQDDPHSAHVPPFTDSLRDAPIVKAAAMLPEVSNAERKKALAQARGMGSSRFASSLSVISFPQRQSSVEGSGRAHVQESFLASVRMLPTTVTRKVLYVGLFLTAHARNMIYGEQGRAVGVCPHLPVQLADHITVVHSPTPLELTPDLVACIGTMVSLDIMALLSTRKVQAAVVTWPGKHVTGFPPVDAVLAAQMQSVNLPEDEEYDNEVLDGPETSPSALELSAASSCSASAEDSGDSTSALIDERRQDPDSVREARAEASGNERVAAATARLGMSSMTKNVVPHITLSTSRGVLASFSNDMLQRGDPRHLVRLEKPFPITAVLGVAVPARGGARAYLLKLTSWERWLAEQRM